MSKAINAKQILDLLDFNIFDDYVVTGTGAYLRYRYFVRILPENIHILPLDERKGLMRRLQNILDIFRGDLSIFSIDKSEGLDEIAEYYKELCDKYPDWEFINREIYDKLEDLDAESAAVERAHYFIFTCKEKSEFERFFGICKENMPVRLAHREEMMIVIRNFFLREFSTVPIMEFDTKVKLAYDQKLGEIKSRRKTPPSLEQIRKLETQKLLLPTTLNFKEKHAVQNDFLRQTIIIRNYPAEFPIDGVLRAAASLKNSTMHIYLSPATTSEVAKMMNNQLQTTTAVKKSTKNQMEKLSAENENERLRQTYISQINNNEQVYFVTVLFEIYASDEKSLKEQLDKLDTRLKPYSLTYDTLPYLQKEAFMSVSPIGDNLFTEIARNMPSRTVAALYPMSASKRVDENGLLVATTTSGSPYIFNPFTRKDGVTNNNICIVGVSGQGKSYLIKMILSMLAAQGKSIYSIDSENEYYDVFSGMGGVNLNCSGGGYIINPLEIRYAGAPDKQYDEDYDPDAFKKSTAYLQHLSWLREFFGVLYPTMPPDCLNVLMILVSKLYESRGIGEDFDVTKADPKQYPTMSDLYDFIYTELENFNSENRLYGADDLKPVLRYLYDAAKGAASAVFNGHTNIPNARFVNFLIKDLLTGDTVIRDAVLFNLVTWVWLRMTTVREEAVLAVDELHNFMIRRTIAWLRNIGKRCRKYNGVLLTATQSPDDYTDPEIMFLAQSMLSEPSHRFYFHLGKCNMQHAMRLLALEPFEMDIIRDSERKHCLAINGKRRYEIVTNTFEYAAALFGKAGGV